jgi:hypothetical protein
MADELLDYFSTGDGLFIHYLLKEFLVKFPDVLGRVEAVVLSQVDQSFDLQRTPLEVAVLLVLKVVDVELISDLVVFKVVVSVHQLLKVQQCTVTYPILLVD